MNLAPSAEASLFMDIMFWVIAVSTIVAAVAVVQLRDMFRAALFLVVCFLGVAGMFVLLGAEFLAAVQVLIYVGAISVLIIFAVLMTADVEEGSPSHSLRLPVGIVAALFAAMAIFVAVSTEWNPVATVATGAQAQDVQTPVTADKPGTTEEVAVVSASTVNKAEEIFSNTIPWIARLLIRDFVLAFEVASVLLLAAIVGALALVREQ